MITSGFLSLTRHPFLSSLIAVLLRRYELIYWARSLVMHVFRLAAVNPLALSHKVRAEVASLVAPR